MAVKKSRKFTGNVIFFFKSCSKDSTFTAVERDATF